MPEFKVVSPFEPSGDQPQAIEALAAGVENGADKCAVIFFPVMLFVLCGFEHCVANMFYLPMGLLCGAGQAAGMAKNLLSVTLGNVLGGVGFALICRAGHGKTE